METLTDGFDFGPVEFATKQLIPKGAWQPKHTLILAGILGTVATLCFVAQLQFNTKKLLLSQQSRDPLTPADNEKSSAEKDKSNDNSESKTL